MALVREGNVPAVIYAHQQVIGKAAERADHEAPALSPEATEQLRTATTDTLLRLLKGGGQ